MSLKWRTSRFLLIGFLRLLFGFRIIGEDRVPRTGKLIICPNHRSYWDPPLVGAATPREVFFLAKEELFHFKPFAWLISFFNAIPIRRDAGGKSAIKTALRLLREGKAIVIFPEGTRNRTEKPFLPFRHGASLLASLSGAPLQPAFIRGPESRTYRWLLREREVSVRFGDPIYPDRYPGGREGLEKMTEDLRRSMEALAECR